MLNRIYQAVNAQLDQPGFKGFLARQALSSKLDRLRTTGSIYHPVWDRIVFNKVKEALGGRVKLIASGSAPIAPEVLEFLKVAFVTDVVEGYGAVCHRAFFCSKEVLIDFLGIRARFRLRIRGRLLFVGLMILNLLEQLEHHKWEWNSNWWMYLI